MRFLNFPYLVPIKSSFLSKSNSSAHDRSLCRYVTSTHPRSHNILHLLHSNRKISNKINTKSYHNGSATLKYSPDSLFNWPHHESGIAAAGTPPSRIYTDETFYQLVEKPITFSQNWLCVGRTAQAPNIGDYVAGTILDQPFVIVNQGEGRYKAFSNVCRHHAALLCDDDTSGHLSTMHSQADPNSPSAYRLTCPYHGWQYSAATGALTKAIKMKGCKDFVASKTLLPKFDVDVVGPWLFLRMRSPSNDSIDSNDPVSVLKDQPDIQEYLTQLQKSEYDVDMVHIHHRKYHIKCNWKVFIDNYLDGGYHVPVAHPKLSANLDMTSYTRRRYSNTFIQTCQSVRSKDHQDTNNASRLSSKDYPALYIYHYPNLCINRYGDWMDTNIVWPINANECVVYFDWFVHKSYLSKQDVIDQAIADSHLVQLEDIMLSERVHKGLMSSCYNIGRYSPELEDGEYFFHQKLYQDFLQSK